MTTSARAQDRANKVVVAHTDGRRLKGYVYNFSPQGHRLHVFPREDSARNEGIEIEVKDVKAIFFVKDFVGRGEHQEPPAAKGALPGRRLEVTFGDGERLRGTTHGYDAQRLGFFVLPDDPHDNNLRIFVINKNVHQVQWL